MKETVLLMKDVVLVGLAFMIHFTAMLGVTHLQSSVNSAEGVGTAALAAQYVALVLSSLLFSVFLMQQLGCKWTIALCIICYVPYMAAQLYPRMYTLVPAAFLMGLAAAPFWSAKCTYLCYVADMYSQVTGGDLRKERDRIIGIFFMVFLFSMVWGNLISSLVLRNDDVHAANSSILSSLQCGAEFCPGSKEAFSNPNLARPREESISLMTIIYIVCIITAAIIVAIGLKNHKRFVKQGVLAQLTATFKLHTKPGMLLMAPISLWLGVDYAFVEAEYTAAYVACSQGISQIGFVLLAYGLSNSMMALITGWMVARIGRLIPMCVVSILHIIVFGCLLVWNPVNTDVLYSFVFAILLGGFDGHWAVQINALYAVAFPGSEDAAYSNFRLWQSVGFIIAFSYSHYVCVAAKIYIVIALLCIGLAGYLFLELGVLKKSV